MTRLFVVGAIISLAGFLLAIVTFGGEAETTLRVPERSAEAWWNEALDKLGAGELAEASWRAERAAIAGGPSFRAQRDFLLGSVAYRRAEKAEALAALPEAGPPALDAAILEAERAARSWLAAARSREDWPAARRNFQRALEKLVYLQKRRELMRENAGKERKNEPPPEETPTDEGKSVEVELPVEIESGELGLAALERLLDRLAEKEREKIALRRKRLNERSAEGGRDW